MATDLSVAIDAIFEKNRAEIDRRITTLEKTVAALLARDLDDALRTSAEHDAHKLAGSLGMFGFPTGSKLAREVAEVLRAGSGPAVSDAPRLAGLVGELRDEFCARATSRIPDDPSTQR